MGLRKDLQSSLYTLFFSPHIFVNKNNIFGSNDEAETW